MDGWTDRQTDGIPPAIVRCTLTNVVDFVTECLTGDIFSML